MTIVTSNAWADIVDNQVDLPASIRRSTSP